MSARDVLHRATELGLPTDDIVLAATPDTVPDGPTGPWVLVPMTSGATIIGALDRGTFSVYAQLDTDDLTLQALRHLTTPVAPRQLDTTTLQGLKAESSRLSADLTSAFRAGARPTAADLPAGTALDHIGPDTGHTLLLLGTPFSRRSAPPTDLQLTRTGYRIATPLPPQCGLSPVVPWFGQPGGGIMITLDHPIRWYTDAGHLQPFAVHAPD